MQVVQEEEEKLDSVLLCIELVFVHRLALLLLYSYFGGGGFEVVVVVVVGIGSATIPRKQFLEYNI